jgi:phenylacetic acid degradation protein paaN
MVSETYKEILGKAGKAISERTFYAAYPEHPKAYDEAANGAAQEWFRNQVGQSFSGLIQTDASGLLGVEISPYTQEPLNILYPAFTVQELVNKAKDTLNPWRYATPEDRAATLMQSLENIKTRFFDIAYATMHTSGQSFMMSFQASGPHANDRALEAIVMGYEELKRFPPTANWEKNMGKFTLKVKKNWQAVSRGIALVIGCSTFPVWNSVPGIFASLITGNTVIVKPHPGAVLPIAIVVAEIQKTLKETGFDPGIIQLAVDTLSEPIAKKLAEHPDVRIIDYTGGNSFGDYVESIPGKISFTEKAGVNSVILDSVDDLDAVMQNLAFAVSLYSGQMCTAPQNFFVPQSGITAGGERISYDEVTSRFKAALTALVTNPKMGAGTLGAIQNLNTIDRAARAKALEGTEILLDSLEVKNDEFPNARILSPLVLSTTSDNRKAYAEELFGPVVLFIKTKDTEESVKIAKELALEKGAISGGAYSTDEKMKNHIMKEMEQAFVPVSFNMTGPIWMNQNAAFSDFHVTGGNPAGNATFTDVAYVVRRFVWIGHKEVV